MLRKLQLLLMVSIVCCSRSHFLFGLGISSSYQDMIWTEVRCRSPIWLLFILNVLYDLNISFDSLLLRNSLIFSFFSMNVCCNPHVSSVNRDVYARWGPAHNFNSEQIWNYDPKRPLGGAVPTNFPFPGRANLTSPNSGLHYHLRPLPGTIFLVAMKIWLPDV